jgi:hypothetical protein
MKRRCFAADKWNPQEDTMFEMLDELDNEDGSAERFDARADQHVQTYGDRKRYFFWWVVHNCIAHPLIGVMPFRPFFEFHDWTSRRINAKD